MMRQACLPGQGAGQLERSAHFVHEEIVMPVFITYASYSNAGVKGMLKKPENRTGPVAALLEKVGGKLLAFTNFVDCRFM